MSVPIYLPESPETSFVSGLSSTIIPDLTAQQPGPSVSPSHAHMVLYGIGSSASAAGQDPFPSHAAESSARPLTTPGASTSTAPTDSLRAHLEAAARKRASESLATEPAHKKQRRERHCAKCDSTDCRGRKSVDLCMNPCRDCLKLTCRGRNTKRPTKPCYLGWDT